jgi:hypothetical protein
MLGFVTSFVLLTLPDAASYISVLFATTVWSFVREFSSLD